jgi:CDP-glucose 4,6-dehydratase
VSQLNQLVGYAKNEIKYQYLSAEKGRRLLNWKPEYSGDESLKETREWYKQFFNRSGEVLTLLNR